MSRFAGKIDHTRKWNIDDAAFSTSSFMIMAAPYATLVERSHDFGCFHGFTR